MITDVKLYEVQCAEDYYELNEKGEQDERACSNLVYTDNNYFLVEWHDENIGVYTLEQKFNGLVEALNFYKIMKAKEGRL